MTTTALDGVLRPEDPGSRALCAGPRCPAAGRRTTPVGSRVCASCREQVARSLRRLPALYRECGERHLRAPAPPWENPIGSRPGPVVPVHGGAADVRSTVLGVLASWAGLTVQVTGVRPPRRDVPDLCAFLGRHLDVLLGHEVAGDFAGELAELVARAERIARPDRVGNLVVGRCPATGCAGRLTARPATDRSQPARLRCDVDARHSWSGPDLLRSGGEPPARPATSTPVASATTHAASTPAGTTNASATAATAPAVTATTPAHTTGTPAITASTPADTTDISATAGSGTASGSDAAGGALSAATRRPRWLSPAGVTALWGVPRGSVYRLASEQRWARRRSGNRTYYALEDVERTLAGTERR